MHFEVHLGEFTGGQEKCVDIALAVDMMHYATVPNAFDVAVLVSGDRDFVPALVRTRQKGKRVAVCSMRNSASFDYEDPEANIKDFGVLWLDDHLDDLVTPIDQSLLSQRPAMASYLRSVIIDYLHSTPLAEAPREELVAHLDQLALGESSAHQYIEYEFGGLLPFVALFPDALRVDRRSQSTAGSELTPVELVVVAVDEGPQAQVHTNGKAARKATTKGALTQRGEPKPDLNGRLRQRTAPERHQKQQQKRETGASDVVGEAVLSAAEQFLSPQLDKEQKEGGGGMRPADPDTVPRDSATERGHAGRSDGALIVDGSLLELLAADVFPADGQALTVADLAHLTVTQLKVELRSRRLSSAGTKPTLLRRLLDALNE
jgi:hypothetical protein